jgi:chromosome segregation ATPase
LLKKSIEDMTKLIKSQNSRLEALEKSTKPVDDKEEIRKSMQSDVIETLAKSYNKKIRSLESENEDIKKSFTTQFEELKKSQDTLSKENAEFKAKLNKPARTRETISNFEPIQKGNSEETGRSFSSKEDILERMEELRKSGKVTGDELISFNASGYMTDNVKKQLRK